MKARWTSCEDELLRAAVVVCGDDWVAISTRVPGRNNAQCYQRYTQSLAPGIKKGKWTKEEDASLVHLVELYTIPAATNPSDKYDRGNIWSELAAQIDGRTAKQCRVRWFGKLSPALNHAEFTKEEDQLVLALHKTLGNRWASISNQMTGRTSDAVKLRFYQLHKGKKRRADAIEHHQPKRQKLSINTANAVKTEKQWVAVAQSVDLDYLEPIVRILSEVQDFDDSVEDSPNFNADLDAWLDEFIPAVSPVVQTEFKWRDILPSPRVAVA